MIAYVERLKELLHATVVGQSPLLEQLLDSVLDFLTGPITGLRTRSYWPELVAALALAGLVFLLRERQAGQGVRGFLGYCFPRRMFLHRSTWVDCQLIVVNHFLASLFNLTWRFNTALFTTALLGGLGWVFGPPPQALAWTGTTLVLLTILFAMAEDFGYYVFHLAAHRIGWLWAFHKVHHSAETLTVFANVRVHPVELALTGPFKAVAGALVMAPALYLFAGNADFTTILGMNLMAAFFGLVGSQLHHSHIWISWGSALEHVLISPAQHQIHHSTAPRHWNRNLGGNFALWDWMFGTLYVPLGREDIRFGLGDGVVQPHPNVLAAYVVPFLELLPSRERLAGLAARIRQPYAPRSRKPV